MVVELRQVAHTCVCRGCYGWGVGLGVGRYFRRPFAVQELGHNRLIIDRMAGVCGFSVTSHNWHILNHKKTILQVNLTPLN